MAISTLNLTDLGATVAIQNDGSVTLSKGWFETLTISAADALKIRDFLNDNIKEAPNG